VREQRVKEVRTILSINLQPPVHVAERVFAENIENFGYILGNLVIYDMCGVLLLSEIGILNLMIGTNNTIVLEVEDLSSRVGAFWGLVARRAVGRKDTVHGHCGTRCGSVRVILWGSLPRILCSQKKCDAERVNWCDVVWFNGTWIDEVRRLVDDRRDGV
jgi:hypothetical protein